MAELHRHLWLVFGRKDRHPAGDLDRRSVPCLALRPTHSGLRRSGFPLLVGHPLSRPWTRMLRFRSPARFLLRWRSFSSHWRRSWKGTRNFKRSPWPSRYACDPLSHCRGDPADTPEISTTASTSNGDSRTPMASSRPLTSPTSSNSSSPPCSSTGNSSRRTRIRTRRPRRRRSGKRRRRRKRKVGKSGSW